MRARCLSPAGVLACLLACHPGEKAPAASGSDVPAPPDDVDAGFSGGTPEDGGTPAPPPEPPQLRTWAAGPELPMLVDGAFVAVDRLWVVGVDRGGRLLSSARLGPDGIPMAWETAPASSSIEISSSYPVWTDGRSTRVIGVGPVRGWGWAASSGPARSAVLHPDGSASPWTAHEEFAPGAYGPGAAILSNHLFSIGGLWWSGGSFSGYGARLPFVHVADVSDDGLPGAWRRTTPLPQPGETWALTIDGNIYVLVQRDLPDLRLYRATPDASGAIAAWALVTAQPPAGVRLQSLQAAGGRLYTTDGTDLWVGSRDASGDVVDWSAFADDRLPRAGFPAQHLVASGSRLYAFVGLSNSETRSAVYLGTIDPATGHLTQPPAQQPPGVPGSVGAVTPSTGMVRISWTAPEGPVTGFEVSQAGGSGVHELLPADARAYTASSLDPLRWTSFSVRALNENGPGPWASTDAIVPWPSSAWRPVDFAEFGGRLAFVAGDTIFDSGDPLSRVIPLDPSGIPWGEIGPRRNPIDPPYLTDAASASLTISDVAACMYVTGGHLGYSGEALSNVAARCVQDDGFLGSSLPRHGTRAAPPMRIARFDHASVTLGDRLYVLGGAQRDASGAVSSLSDVSSAPIGADFVPGAWQSTTPLPFPAHGVAAAAWSGRIYVVAPTPGRVRILVAQPGVDGPIAEWRETLGFTANREGASTAIASGFLYVLGGNADGEPSVAIGRIDEDTGNVVSWSTDPADSFVGQPKRPAVVLRGNRLYVFGSGITLQVADIDPTTGRPLRWR